MYSAGNVPTLVPKSHQDMVAAVFRTIFDGDKRFHHPAVGDLTLSFEEIPLPADPGLTITAYTTRRQSGRRGERSATNRTR